MSDRFYTPQFLAEQVTDALGDVRPKVIIDTAAGEGILLKTSLKRWPNAYRIGCDIDRSALSIMRNRKIANSVIYRDALDMQKRSATTKRLLRHGRPDLALINPPFSGIKIFSFTDPKHRITITATKPMVFLLDALAIIKPNGIVAAILPEGVFFRKVDATARKIIDELATVIHSERIDLSSFGSVSGNARIIIYKKRRFDNFPVSLSCCEQLKNQSEFSLSRGQCSPKSITVGGNKKSPYFIHTSNLKHNKTVNVVGILGNTGNTVAGPCVFIPRVGRPSKEKIVFKKESRQYVLSDCVIAVSHPNVNILKELYTSIVAGWEGFSSLYEGTGAKFITLDKIRSYILKQKL